MTEQRSPRVGDEVEVRIPRARVRTFRGSTWVELTNDAIVHVTHCSALSSPPQPGERIYTVERLAECAVGTVFAPDDLDWSVHEVTGDGYWYRPGAAEPRGDPSVLLPGRVLAIRGQQ